MAAIRSRGVLLSQYSRSSLIDESLFKSSFLTVFQSCFFTMHHVVDVLFPNAKLKPRSHALRGNTLSDGLRPFWALIIVSAILPLLSAAPTGL